MIEWMPHETLENQKSKTKLKRKSKTFFKLY